MAVELHSGHAAPPREVLAQESLRIMLAVGRLAGTVSAGAPQDAIADAFSSLIERIAVERTAEREAIVTRIARQAL